VRNLENPTDLALVN